MREVLSMRIARISTLLILSACLHDTTGVSNAAQLPADAVFVTSDIGHFWEAYDKASPATATNFRTLYLDRASPGLLDFMQSRSLTGTSLAQMVNAYPRYFAAIKANMLTLTSGGSSPIITTIRANFDKIESRYPRAVYPPVTFLVGRFSTGGTTSDNGMLIGTEFYSIDANTPLDELGKFQSDNVRSLDSLPLIVAHEHAHVLQLNAGQRFGIPGSTLLHRSIMEVSADFISEQVAGSHINKSIYVYGYANEAQLWSEFKLVMNGTDVSQWLYNQGTATGTRPGDLGYFIGYRIAQAYYNKMSDKTKAFADIIEARDATAFLTASGYDGK